MGPQPSRRREAGAASRVHSQLQSRCGACLWDFMAAARLTLGCKGEGLQPLSEPQAAPEADVEGG